MQDLYLLPVFIIVSLLILNELTIFLLILKYCFIRYSMYSIVYIVYNACFMLIINICSNKINVHKWA